MVLIGLAAHKKDFAIEIDYCVKLFMLCFIHFGSISLINQFDCAIG